MIKKEEKNQEDGWFRPKSEWRSSHHANQFGMSVYSTSSGLSYLLDFLYLLYIANLMLFTASRTSTTVSSAALSHTPPDPAS